MKFNDLETVATDLSIIEGEPGVNAVGEAVGETEEEAVEEGATLAAMPSFAALEDISVSDFSAAPLMLSVNNSDNLADNSYYVLRSGSTLYYCFFPQGTVLGVSDDGFVYNPTSANIVGVYSTSPDGIKLNSYNNTITLQPLFTSGGNNYAYQYGSRVYLTTYRPSTGNSLSGTVSYVSNMQLESKPALGSGFSSYQIAVLGLLLLIAIVHIIRSVWRD